MLVSIFAIPAELHSVACGKHQGCKTLAMLQCLSNGRHAVFINFIRLLPTCQSLALINASEHGWSLKIQGREAAVVLQCQCQSSTAVVADFIALQRCE